MKIFSDALYERVMDNLEDKEVRQMVFDEVLNIPQAEDICGALETDLNYWEGVLKRHPNDKPEILSHIRKYIERDEELIKALIKLDR